MRQHGRMQRDEVRRWVAGYERAWRTAGTGALTGLFTEDVTYQVSPWAEPVVGLPAVRVLWEAERQGPDEEFTLASELVAVDGDVAVVRVQVTYARESAGQWRDLWVLRFGPDSRCRAFEEWPFAPGQPDGH